MMNEKDTPPPPNPSPETLAPPPAGAPFHEAQAYINARRRQVQATNSYNSYYLQDFLEETPPLPPKEGLKHDYLTNSFSDQLHVMNLAMQYCLYYKGSGGLDQAVYLQRRFCETIRLIHKIKSDNRARKQSKSKPVTS